MERKLAAILSADVKGYSRLMAEDEEATIETLNQYRAVMASLIEQHRGRVVDSPGDNLLAEFGSVVDAVQGAVSIQMELNIQNAALEEESNRRMDFRIGINLGDVVSEGDKIYGDGVNIAARIESLAEAGGICISGTVHEHIKNKLPLGYIPMGDQSVKNIAEPVRVYRVRSRAGLDSSKNKETRSGSVGSGSSTSRQLPARQKFGAAAAIVLGLAAIVFFILSAPNTRMGKADRESRPNPARQRVAAQGPIAPVGAAPPSSALSRPSDIEAESKQAAMLASHGQQGPTAIGVMNFKPLSPDPDSSWMQEAIRDRLNGQLNKVSGVEVFSKEYIDFLVQDGSTEIKIAHDLGISKMVSGSYRAQGSRLRIEAHVVNVQTGLLEASDSVEGAQEDFFELQNELAFKLASHLNLVVSPEARAAIAVTSSRPGLDAYRLLLEAEGDFDEPSSTESLQEIPEGRSEDEASTRHLHFLSFEWLGPRAAWADDSLPPKQEIRDVLERYRLAYETKDLDLLATVYTDLTPKQLRARKRYFKNTQDLEVAIHGVQIAVRGDDAVVSYTREDRFTDSKTGETVNLDVRLTKKLHRVDGDWKIMKAKK